MKAVTYKKYGPPEVLELTEMTIPKPSENEVLVKVHASTVTKYDCWMRSCTAPPGFGLPMRIVSGIRKPKKPILGTELSGEIECVGNSVTGLKAGDQVVGYTGMSLGAYAEYICLPQDAVVLKPAVSTYCEAAAVLQGALTALYFLRKANIQSGQKVLIFGASGGIGTYAVQLAKHFGAEVTGVCCTAKLDYVRSLGADHVIDYKESDFTKNGETYDIIFDTVGKSSVLDCGRSLNEKGTYVLATFGLWMYIQTQWLSITSNRKVVSGVVEERIEDMVFIEELIEEGKLKPVVDKCYPLDQAAEAHKYAESGDKMGSVVITMEYN